MMTEIWNLSFKKESSKKEAVCNFKRTAMKGQREESKRKYRRKYAEGFVIENKGGSPALARRSELHEESFFLSSFSSFYFPSILFFLNNHILPEDFSI